MLHYCHHMVKTTPTRHTIKETCTRCGGFGNTGHRRCAGICFRCSGIGYTMSEVIFNVVAIEAAPVQTVAMPDLFGENWIESLFAA
jgi:hypothetical protein